MAIVVISQFSTCFIFKKHNKYIKIVKFNVLTFLLQLQLVIFNLFLYLKVLFNKEIDCLSKITEKSSKNQRMFGLWVSYPLKR